MGGERFQLVKFQVEGDVHVDCIIPKIGEITGLGMDADRVKGTIRVYVPPTCSVEEIKSKVLSGVEGFSFLGIQEGSSKPSEARMSTWRRLRSILALPFLLASCATAQSAVQPSVVDEPSAKVGMTSPEKEKEDVFAKWEKVRVKLDVLFKKYDLFKKGEGSGDMFPEFSEAYIALQGFEPEYKELCFREGGLDALSEDEIGLVGAVMGASQRLSAIIEDNGACLLPGESKDGK